MNPDMFEVVGEVEIGGPPWDRKCVRRVVLYRFRSHRKFSMWE